MDLKTRAEEEIQRLEGILDTAGVSDHKKKVLKPIIENTAWMKAKLDDTRTLIQKTDVVVPYDNGGGQKGLRENPAFKGYEKLFSSYINGMNRIIDALPQDIFTTEKLVEDEMRPKSVLELVKARHPA